VNELEKSRRTFLHQGVTVAGVSWARLLTPSLAVLSRTAWAASDDQAPFVTLDRDEATEFEAIVGRILPKTDTAGAKEAGVIYFLDRTFTSFNQPMLVPARAGLQKFQADIEGAGLFSNLSEIDQDAHLDGQQHTPFFAMMRFLTMCGFFGMSKYGGNKDSIGWELVGMSPDTHVYESPFGYYDAEYMRENSSG